MGKKCATFTGKKQDKMQLNILMNLAIKNSKLKMQEKNFWEDCKIRRAGKREMNEKCEELESNQN